MRSLFWAAVVATAGALVIAAAVRIDELGHGVDARYFDNTRQLGTPVRTVREPGLSSDRASSDWGADAPFSAQWSGWLATWRTGTYQFALATDGNARLRIDGIDVVSSDGRSPDGALGSIPLASGSHYVVVDYEHERGPIRIDLRYSRLGRTLQPIPSVLWTPRRPRPLGVATAEALLTTAAAAEWIWLAVMLALGGALAWKAVVYLKHQLERDGEWSPLCWILLGSVLLNLAGFWWGLPARWFAIELLPEYVLDGLQLHFSHGWYDAYPPFHYYILTVAMSPFLLLSWWGRVAFEQVYMDAMIVSRLVTIAFAAGVVVASYRTGQLVFGRRAGLFAAAMMALTAPFVYYAKSANVDCPYLFWFALSMVSYVRVLQRGWLRDYVLLATFGMLAVCTKDQAAALYLFVPFVIVWERWRRGRQAGERHAFLAALTDRRMWIGGAAAVVVFAIVHNVLFNLNGFLDHVRFILGNGSVPFRVFDPTLVGHVQLLGLSLALTQQALNWPLTIAAAVGLGIAFFSARWRRVAIWLLLPVLSYYLGFIDRIGYNYDRFMLPACFVLVLFGGLALSTLVEHDTSRRWSTGLVAAVFAYSILYAGAVDYLMIRDSRYATERWLATHVPAGEIVGASGQREYIPRLESFRQADIPNLEALESVRPMYVLENADYGRAVPPETGWGQLIDALTRGSHGYTFARRFRTPLPWSWIPGMHHDLTGPRQESIVFSTLRNVNPTIDVYQRVDPAHR